MSAAISDGSAIASTVSVSGAGAGEGVGTSRGRADTSGCGAAQPASKTAAASMIKTVRTRIKLLKPSGVKVRQEKGLNGGAAYPFAAVLSISTM
jgi:hypothetical protein